MINCLLEARVRGHDRRSKIFELSAQLIGCECVNPLSEPLVLSLRDKLLYFATAHVLLKPAQGELFCETGPAEMLGIVNLEISQRRAEAVLKGLLARGIPADRFQVLAKGETELPVPTNSGVAELQNRRVEITWR
jgi:hypothetical protein